MKKIIVCILIIFCLFILSNNSVYAKVENFDNYSEGQDLFNLPDWHTPQTGIYTISSDYGYTGKGVRAYKDTAAWTAATTDFTPISSDYIQTLYIKVLNLANSGYFQWRIYDNAYHGMVFTINDGNWYLQEGQENKTQGIFNYYEWIKVDLEVHSDRIRIKINNNEWSDYIAWNYGTISKYQMSIYGNDINPSVVYFDNFEEQDITPPPLIEHTYASISAADITNIMGYSNELLNDTAPAVAMVVGLPIGFWFIYQIINLVKRRKD